MSERLPNAEEVFDVWFRPWYPDQGNDRTLYGLRTDLEEIELPAATPINVLQPLDRISERQQVLAHLAGMLDAAKADWPTLFGVDGDPDRRWIDALECAATDERIRTWIEQSPADTLQNTLLIITCEAATLLARLLQDQRPALQWLPDIPYWDSCLFDLNSKVRIPVFHWVIKRLSADGANEPLGKKIDATLSFLEETP